MGTPPTSTAPRFDTGTQPIDAAPPAAKTSGLALPSTIGRAAFDPALLGSAALLAALLPLARWWHRRSRLPRVHTMEVTLPKVSQESPLPTPPAALGPTSGHAAAETPTSRRCVILEERPEQVDLIPPTPIPEGAASLADREAARFALQVQGLAEEGYRDVAVALLEKALTATPARNPWLMLQLLALHEQDGRLDRMAELISELQTLYRVQLPVLRGAVRQGHGLLEHPSLSQQIEPYWNTDDAVEILEDLIYRVPGPTWDLAAFSDLLLLHAIARDRSPLEASATPAPTKAFEPVLEWTIDEP